MTDRELLELAAKAIGLHDITYFDEGAAGGKGMRRDELDWDNWNPLDDDGDAFRLSVKLGINLLFTSEDVEAVATQYARREDQEMISPWACESLTLKQQDLYAATRRAIVRAAAEIGRSM